MEPSNNQFQQPQPVSEPTPTPPITPSTVNPGKTLGILGIVLSFLFLQLIGIVLSIISTIKSSRAKASPVLGIIGIVLNGIGLVVMPILLIITLLTYGGIQERAKAVAVKTNANEVVKRAEAYYALEGRYPQSIDDFADHSESELIVDGKQLNVTPHPPINSAIQYEVCGPYGAHVAYFDPSANSLADDTPVDIPLINASRVSDCD